MSNELSHHSKEDSAREVPREEGPSEEASFQQASDLRLAVFRLARRLRAERGENQLSEPQHLVLAALYHNGPLSLGELATHERVSAPSMNRTVNCLEEQGYVTRSSNSEDRRRVTIEITPAGSTLVDEVKRVRTSWLVDAMHELTDAERQQLAAATPILHRMAAL